MEAVRVGESEVLGMLKEILECGNEPFEESKVKDHMKADFVENLMYLNEINNCLLCENRCHMKLTLQ